MIDSFSGEYHFLSNFSAAEVWLDGVSYASVEHAYQAAKTDSTSARRRIQTAKTPNEAKRLGRAVKLREDWEEIKLEVMYQLVRQKFRQHPSYSSYLLKTEDEELVEGNWWGDTYWGVCNGTGENHLGKILMRIREELVNRIDGGPVHSQANG